MNKKISGSALAILILAMLATQVFATTFELPEGGKWIKNLSAGDAVVDCPEDFFIPQMYIHAAHFETSSYGPGTTIFLFMKMPGTDWFPFAQFTTNPEHREFAETIYTGLPASVNAFLVSENEVKVDRQDNRITATLTEDKVILMRTGPVTIPAFTMELNKVGGSFHTEDTQVLNGYPGASGYTIIRESMGFSGNGAFTCSEWDYNAKPMTDCVITMHRTAIFLPPAPS